MLELLSPVGDFECLKAAVQNGADAVYFGASSFSARAFASNFDENELEKAINYAKLRGVKTNLTLNTLIKDDEFEEAFNLAKTAYNLGIDAIIVQDLGLATELLKAFPNIVLHASTQMTVHNLEGVKKLENLGFKRVVLSRELSLPEIEYICSNTNIEIEVFIHGALCISYSGQCLFSSMVGGRSGNRGKCAQPCRLPYKLLENENKIDSGYLLSTRDLCGLEFIPQLINSNVSCLKIEGRMKKPEYVATVTKIYRKYIDLYNSKKPYIIDETDKRDLMQVFNRGGFSNGHLNKTNNQHLIYKEKQNHMGIYIGTISKYNNNKGLITCKLKDALQIGDTVSFEKENSKYTISELMDKNTNIKTGYTNQDVTFGRMKGNINIGNKIYKVSSKTLAETALNSFVKEHRKSPLTCKVNILKNEKITVNVFSKRYNIETDFTYDYIPLDAQNKPLDKEKVLNQFMKTTDTPFEFTNIDINLDNDLFLPISVLNDLRRLSIKKIEDLILATFKNKSEANLENLDFTKKTNLKEQKISLLLTELNNNFDYTFLKNISKLYIPLKYFYLRDFEDTLKSITTNFNTYIYMPTIIKDEFLSKTLSVIKTAINTFNIKGFVVSHISQLDILKDFKDKDFIANYTFNIFNKYTENELKNLGINTLTISPELDKNSISKLCDINTNIELIVYSNIPLMTSNYCLLGNNNKCNNNCSKKCLENNKYFLEDRLGFKFRVIPDNIQTITTIYNSKTTSICSNDFNIDFSRIDILDENINEINNIIEIVKSGNRLEGKQYTNSNLNREI